MILLFSPTITSRLQYICHFIFKEQLGVEYELTNDPEKFRIYNGAKVSYCESAVSVDEFHIQSHALLFEQDIKIQQTDCFPVNNNKAFFKVETGDFPFDILAASFYLLSRYEEYLPHEKDIYGRYNFEDSLAYKAGFLNLPMINIWIGDFAASLKIKYPALAIKHPAFKAEFTYDIDIAYSYNYKGLMRNIGGFFKDPGLERLKVLTGIIKDPFDCYDWLDQLHQQYKIQPLYFFLVAKVNAVYDKNILPHKKAMWKLVKHHADRYRVGLHPSWQSGDDKSLLKKEREQLEAMSGKKISMSRQHYIRFNLPEGYQRLISAGISDDYSMGYGSINGFRASVASSFLWYSLEKEVQTSLRIHPFCFMDANSLYEQQQGPLQTLDELMHYLSICKHINGTLITIWHNNFLGTAAAFAGWKDIYEQFIVQVQQ